MENLDTLVNSILDNYHNTCNDPHSGRIIVGIVGKPACGKTTFAASLTDTINKRLGFNRSDVSLHPPAMTISMDGYHLPRSVLSARHTNHSSDYASSDYTQPDITKDFNIDLLYKYDQTIDLNEQAGQYEQHHIDQQTYAIDPDRLYKPWPGEKRAFDRRGAHWTFDPYLFAYNLYLLKYNPCNELQQYYNGWDHSIKDPSYNDIIIHNNTRILICDGLYLYLSLSPWCNLLHTSQYYPFFKKQIQLRYKTLQLHDDVYNNTIIDNSDIDTSYYIKDSEDKATTNNSNDSYSESSLFDYGILIDCSDELSIQRGTIRNYNAGIVPTMEASIERWNNNDLPNGHMLLDNILSNKINYTFNQEELSQFIDAIPQ